MLTTIAKRIQSSLSRKGVKASLGEIKKECDRLITDINNATDEEVLTVTQFFLDNATQLTVITEDIEAVGVSEDDKDYPEVPAPLATTTKNELVSTTAQGLGVVLNEAEIEAIATNVNVSSDDLQETLEEIKGAIIAFIKYRIANNSQKIDETLGEIVQVATDGFNANSQQLTNGLRSINQQMQQQSQDFKSKVKVTLKCFQLPEAS
jgi:uncharacterized protein YukE